MQSLDISVNLFVITSLLLSIRHFIYEYSVDVIQFIISINVGNHRGHVALAVLGGHVAENAAARGSEVIDNGHIVGVAGSAGAARWVQDGLDLDRAGVPGELVPGIQTGTSGIEVSGDELGDLARSGPPGGDGNQDRGHERREQDLVDNNADTTHDHASWAGLPTTRAIVPA